MKRTEIDFDIESVPASVRPYLQGAAIYDSSGHTAATLFVQGAEPGFLKIGKKGSLEREYRMTRYLHGRKLAPKAIAFASDAERDYLFTEALRGEDGTADHHLEQPAKLAAAFGEYLRMLHSLPADGCPYPNRSAEMLRQAADRGIDVSVLHEFRYRPVDGVLLHGDYCLPNIIMDRFSFQGFIDVGEGGIGDRHYDLYWGIWTLGYNLKTDRYNDVFLDAYGKADVDEEGLSFFAKLVELTN
ncbi:aminoglycoside 3'-phosphotransferase [Paenibacillus thermotolerans]|uniref:aminoglycoside 3'-phosphotransferase n=1 Tax=Paenibacillus thermotolerans TaxID=3027807 RepID=UPI0023678CC9|nr:MULTISPECIES: aminoglycoside 3'-phosphotransferase [unclassified Paenibacillus]